MFQLLNLTDEQKAELTAQLNQALTYVNAYLRDMPCAVNRLAVAQERANDIATAQHQIEMERLRNEHERLAIERERHQVGR